MFIRNLSVLLLSALLTATATSQPVAKDPAKEKEVSKEPKWPDTIGDKKLSDWLKIAINDPDAAMREQALQVIPSFNPADVRKSCVKPLWRRIAGESDNGVRLVVIDLLGSIGIEDPVDLKDTLTALIPYADGDKGSVNKLHTLQAIAKFGHKAHGVARALANSELVTKDSSFEVRRTAAQTLGRIAATETDGPNFAVLKQLSTTLVKDSALPVRLEALQSLFILGPPYETAKTKKNEPPSIDEKAGQEIVGLIKPRVTGTKPAETNKQAELWCRLVIIRFGGPDDIKDQLNGIAAHLSDADDTVKYHTLFALRLLSPLNEEKIQPVVNILNSKAQPVLREAALQTLGAMGEQALEPIRKVIEDPTEEPEMRIAALKALAMLGEKAEKGRAVVVEIIKDPSNLKDPTQSKIALLQQACLTLASMGVKAQSEVPVLKNLSADLLDLKTKRLKGEDYQKWYKNPETQRWLNSLKPDDRDDILKNHHPEDQFKRFVDEAIQFINKSEPGHPGGDPKKPPLKG